MTDFDMALRIPSGQEQGVMGTVPGHGLAGKYTPAHCAELRD